MKHLPCIFLLVLSVTFLSCNRFYNHNKQTVNPVIGDVSFVKKFGYQPSASTDNTLRVATHLEYAENILRAKDVSWLPPDLQTKRMKMLDLLHQYWTAGIFPKNYDYADERKPCFIDKDGTICAVGYLIEQTTNRQVAEEINNKHKYDELLAMNDKKVDDWIRNSGLTKQECATIQPTYGNPTPVYSANYIKPSYGISSAVLGGISLSLNTLNSVQIAGGSKTRVVPVIGLATGASK